MDPNNQNGESGDVPQQSQDVGFLRRMAGPSVNKAGLAKDQTEINRVIAEASKKTKFYENEKRRDNDWTIRINKILSRRDELLRESDIAGVERKVDRIFAEMEDQRDLSQTIVHLDMDAFFANVETLHNPDLEGKPFVVVGLGIVTTASYAARKFGVRSAMPEFIAKKLCPEILLVPVDYKRVGEMSGKVMKICKEYDPNMFIAGCDEGYLNITTYMDENNLTADDCVQQLRARIHEETKLTASAGIAPNMMLAKICSDKNKPNGQFHMPFDRNAIMEFMRELPVRKVPGIGRVGERVLEAIGVKTCGDIGKHRAVIWLMPRKFSVNFLFETHLGISSNRVQPGQREERKSVGASRTFKPVSTEEAIYQKLEYIASLLERDLETEGWAGNVFILTVKLDTFKVFTRMKHLGRYIQKKEDLFAIGKELIKPELPLRIRLLGLRVTNLMDLRQPDRGIKRYFESEGQSPVKKQKTSNDAANSGSGGERARTPPIVDLTNIDDQEEALVGEAVMHEDELEEDDDDDNEEEETEEMEAMRVQAGFLNTSELPAFRYRKPPSLIEGATKTPLARTHRATTRSPTKPTTTKVMRSNAVAGTSHPRPPLSVGATGRSMSITPVKAMPISQLAIPPNPNLNSKAKTAASRASSRASSRAPSRTPEIRSTPTPHKPKVKKKTEIMVCPICSRELEVDNSGLNEHVDFCLSRGAIREATTVTSDAGPSGTNSTRKSKNGNG